MKKRVRRKRKIKHKSTASLPVNRARLSHKEDVDAGLRLVGGLVFGFLGFLEAMMERDIHKQARELGFRRMDVIDTEGVEVPDGHETKALPSVRSSETVQRGQQRKRSGSKRKDVDDR